MGRRSPYWCFHVLNKAVKLLTHQHYLPGCINYFNTGQLYECGLVMFCWQPMNPSLRVTANERNSSISFSHKAAELSVNFLSSTMICCILDRYLPYRKAVTYRSKSHVLQLLSFYTLTHLLCSLSVQRFAYTNHRTLLSMPVSLHQET